MGSILRRIFGLYIEYTVLYKLSIFGTKFRRSWAEFGM